MDELKGLNSPSTPQVNRRVAAPVVNREGQLPPATANGSVDQAGRQTVGDGVPAGRQDEAGPQRTDDVRNAVRQLNDFVQNVQRSLQFDFDDQAGRSVITVVDRDTQEVIRQIPDELALKLARNLSDEGQLSLFTTKV